MSHSRSGASSPHPGGPLLPPVSPRPPSGPRAATAGASSSSFGIRPQSAMRMGLLGSVAAASSASASASAAASSARGRPGQPWVGHLAVASPSVQFMARHSSAATPTSSADAAATQPPSWLRDPKRAAAMTAWIEQVRAFLREAQTDTTAAATRTSNGAAATTKTNTGATPAVAGSTAAAEPALPPSALEGLSLSLTVRLLPNLAHHSSAIRSRVAHLLLQLGSVFGDSVGRNALVDELLKAARPTQQPQQQTAVKRTPSTSGGQSSDAARQATPTPAAADRMQAIVDAMLSEPDLSASLRLFFTLMGPGTLAPLALSLVERLESSYTHSSPAVRDAAILISGALMSLHVDLFRAQGAREGLVGVWNLFFMLDWMSGGGGGGGGGGDGGNQSALHSAHAEARGGGSESLAKLGGIASHAGSSDAHHSLHSRLPLSGGRVAIIESLGLVCDLYVEANLSLALQIVSRLLRLPDKSARETRAVKNAVLAIGNACIERALAIVAANANGSGATTAAAAAAASATASRAASPSALDRATSFSAFSAAASAAAAAAAAAAASSPAATAASYSLYPTLLSTLSAHREEHLDLLGWATFAYTCNVQNAQWNAHMSAPFGTGAAASSSSRSGSAAAAPSFSSSHAPRPILTDSRDIDALYFSSSAGSGSVSGRVGLVRPSVSYPVDMLRESSTLVVALPAELSEFLSSLESHLRASPPLIRLGAAQALQALLKIYPSVLAWGAASASASSSSPAAAATATAAASRQALLFPHILWGCADESHAVSATYVAILADIARGVGHEPLQRAIVRYQSSIVGGQQLRRTQPVASRSLASMPASVRGSPESSRPPSSLAGSHVAAAASSASIVAAAAASAAAAADDPPSLSSVLALAISLAPPVPSRFLAFVLSSLSSLRGASHRLLLLHLVAEWCAHLREVEPVFVDKLLPILMGEQEEAEITAAAGAADAADDAWYADSSAAGSAAVPSSSHPFATAEMSCVVLRMLKRLSLPPAAPLHASLAPHHLLALTSWALGILARAPGTAFRAVDGSVAAGDESLDDDGAASTALSSPLSRFESQALESRIIALLDLLPCLPLERLPASRIEALLPICLGRLLHSPSRAVRAALYSFLASSASAAAGSAAPKWLSSKQLLSRACSILLAGLGDTCASNVSLALSGLLVLVAQMHLVYASSDSGRDGRHCLLAEALRKARDALLTGRGLLERLAAYDALARCFALPSDSGAQIALASIRECVTSAEFAPFAARLLSSVQSTAAGGAAPSAAPSLHAHWWALLLTHCGHTIRRQVPVMLLLPLLGVSVDPADAPLGSAGAGWEDASMRAATAHTIKRACILVGGVCNERLVSDLVSALYRMLDPSAGSVANAAGYYLMSVLSPLRLKGLAGFLVRRFLAPALQLLPSPNLAPSLRRSVLLCVEGWVMLHPKLCFPYLENLRNALREMLCLGSHATGGGAARSGDKHASSTGSSTTHLTRLSRLYTLVCFTASLHAPAGSSSVADNYFAYLRADLAALSGAEERATFGAAGAPAATADPLLSSLTAAQLRIVTLATLQALGCMDGPASRALAPAALDELLRFLAHGDASTRYFAAEALAIQMGLGSASPQQTALAKWTLLPLIADPEIAVRVVVVAACGLGLGDAAARGSVQNPARRRMARMMPEDDDTFEAAVTPAAAAGDAAASSSSSSAATAKPAKIPRGKKGAAAAAAVASAAAAAAAQAVATPAFALPSGSIADSGVAAILSRVDSEDPWYAEEDDTILGAAVGSAAAAADAAAFAVPLITPAFHRHLSAVIRARIEFFPAFDRFDELLYLLGAQSSALRGSQVPGVVALVLGELCTYNLGAEWGERCEAVVRNLLLSLEAPVTALSKPLIFGSVLALQCLACSRVCRSWSRELQPVSLLFAHLSDDDASGPWLREGQLVALAAIVLEPKVDLAAVDAEHVDAVTTKLMKSLKDASAHSHSAIAGLSGTTVSAHSSPRSHQLCLEILAALCEKVEDLSAVSSILGYLFEILASSADPAFHERCSTQLRKLFASLPEDHPLLDTFAAALAIDVRSPRLESRLRALTTLVILGPRLQSPQRTQCFLRLLADPDRGVKHHALSVLMNPASGFAAEAAALMPVVKAMGREALQQAQQSHTQSLKAPSPSPSPVPGASPADKKSSLLAAAKRPQEQRRSGGVGAGVLRDAASMPLEDLSDQQLLRLMEDVSDSYERRVAADALAAAGGFRAHNSNGSSSTVTSAVQAPSIPSVSSASAADATRPLLSIPLADLDPFNLRLQRSPAWDALLKAYGLPSAVSAVSGMSAEEWERHAAMASSKDLLASFQQLTAASSSAASAPELAPDADTDAPTMLDRLPASKRHELISLLRAKQIAHLDFAPLVAALLRLDAGNAGEAVAAELLAHFQALSREEEEAIDAAAAINAAAATSKPASASSSSATAAKTTKSFVLGAASSSAAAADSTADHPPLELVSKLHGLGVLLNLLSGFRSSAGAASAVAAGGGAAAAFVSNAAQAEREAFGSKLSVVLAGLQAAGTRFRAYAESLRARSLKALSNLTAFRAPGAATRWRHTSTPRSERDFQRREAYIHVVMNQPADEQGIRSKAGQNEDAEAMPQTKQGLLEKQRELERDINEWATQLGRVTTLQVAVVRSISKLLSPASSGPAAVVALSDAPTLDPAVVSATFLWLGAMFADTHRGVRATVREGIVGLVAAQCSAQSAASIIGKPTSASARASPPAASSSATDPPLLLQVQRSIYTLFHSLRDCAAPPVTVEGGHLFASSGPSAAWLYTRRARADLVYLLGRLVVFKSIEAVHAMMRDRVPETMMEPAEAVPSTTDGHAKDNEAIGAATNLSVGSRTSPLLMKSILSRLRDADYGDKEKLSALLNSCFVG